MATKALSSAAVTDAQRPAVRQPRPALPSFHLPALHEDASAVLPHAGGQMFLVMCRSALAGVGAQGRCFGDCNLCYVLSLGFAQAYGYLENSLPSLFLKSRVPTCANCVPATSEPE